MGAGINRSSVHVTNVVTHFRSTTWEAADPPAAEPDPGRRLPALVPSGAARGDTVRARVAGCRASQAVFGPGFRVTSQPGLELQTPDGTTSIATLRPSSILRGSPDSRKSGMRDLVDDLTLAAETLDRIGGHHGATRCSASILSASPHGDGPRLRASFREHAAELEALIDATRQAGVPWVDACAVVDPANARIARAYLEEFSAHAWPSAGTQRVISGGVPVRPSRMTQAAGFGKFHKGLLVALFCSTS